MPAGSGRPTNILKMLHFLSALGFGEQRVGSLSVGGTWESEPPPTLLASGAGALLVGFGLSEAALQW